MWVERPLEVGPGLASPDGPLLHAGPPCRPRPGLLHQELSCPAVSAAVQRPQRPSVATASVAARLRPGRGRGAGRRDGTEPARAARPPRGRRRSAPTCSWRPGRRGWRRCQQGHCEGAPGPAEHLLRAGPLRSCGVRPRSALTAATACCRPPKPTRLAGAGAPPAGGRGRMGWLDRSGSGLSDLNFRPGRLECQGRGRGGAFREDEIEGGA